jgi:competence protein ComEA
MPPPTTPEAAMAPPPPVGPPADPAPPPGSATPVSLNSASFEELRDVGLSVTQTGRVLAHRERGGGFTSLDELDEIPGFPQDFLEQVKPRLTV